MHRLQVSEEQVLTACVPDDQEAIRVGIPIDSQMSSSIIAESFKFYCAYFADNFDLLG